MEFMLLGLFFAMCLGVIPGLIAQSKGRSFAEWWLYGAALFIVALPHSLMLEKKDTPIGGNNTVTNTEGGPRYRCPNCHTPVGPDATRCPGCGGLFKAGMTKKCPDCAETVKYEARKCRFCGY